jgi:hypothetical protein
MTIGEIAWLDQHQAHVTAMVREHGWFIQYVSGRMCDRPGCDCGDAEEDGLAFAYTIGLFGLNHPELLILGVPPQTAGGVLNELGRRVKAGETLLPGSLITFKEWPHRIVPEEVPNPQEIVLGANGYYRMPAGTSVPVLQLSYDDVAGRFPWQEGYSAPGLQPRPGDFRA